MELSLWCNGISGILGALGRRFHRSPAQWVGDLALPQLQSRFQFQLGSAPWPGNFICCVWVGQKRKRHTGSSHCGKQVKVMALSLWQCRFNPQPGAVNKGSSVAAAMI